MGTSWSKEPKEPDSSDAWLYGVVVLVLLAGCILTLLVAWVF